MMDNRKEISTSGPGPAAALGALVGTGGLIGFVTSRSVPSLIAGSLIGGGFGTCAFFLGDDKSALQQQRAATSATALSTLTGLYMGKKALSTRQNVRSFEVLADGSFKYGPLAICLRSFVPAHNTHTVVSPVAVHTNHFQKSLRSYFKPGGIKWMPGGVVFVASTATAAYYAGAHVHLQRAYHTMAHWTLQRLTTTADPPAAAAAAAADQ